MKLFWTASFLIVFAACSNDVKETQKEYVPDFDALEGQELAQAACAACHSYTPPSLLPKQVWKDHVLPNMAQRLGLRFGSDPNRGSTVEETYYIHASGAYPTEQLISDSAWNRLEQYYLENAPDSLSISAVPDFPMSTLFEASILPYHLGGFGAVTLVEYDTAEQKMYVGDINGQLVKLNSSFEMEEITQFQAPIVDILVYQDQLLVDQIGFLDKNDQLAGLIGWTDSKTLSRRAILLQEMLRPVYFEMHDVDRDSHLDLVVCNFGNHSGNLSWYRSLGTGYEQHVIKNGTGALKFEAADLDADGDTDIVALFGQGREGVFAFTNHGYGNFHEDQWVDLHPLMGASDFEWIDLDHNGSRELVIACGDNSDYSPVLKSYHGVYIFEEVEGEYRQTDFIECHGATGLNVADFDLDGDQDIFVNAFYPDYIDGLDQSLLILENDSSTFTVEKIPLAHLGRWLVADLCDMDQDGDQDILVGSFALGPGQVPPKVLDAWQRTHSHFLYLENNTL